METEEVGVSKKVSSDGGDASLVDDIEKLLDVLINGGFV